MGNQLDNGKYGDISIKTKKLYYKPHEQVDGMIYIDLKSEFPSNLIYLILKGSEKIIINDYSKPEVKELRNE